MYAITPINVHNNPVFVCKNPAKKKKRIFPLHPL